MSIVLWVFGFYAAKYEPCQESHDCAEKFGFYPLRRYAPAPLEKQGEPFFALTFASTALRQHQVQNLPLLWECPAELTVVPPPLLLSFCGIGWRVSV